jgi:DNA-binding beta-propeller fold protein YncE
MNRACGLRVASALSLLLGLGAPLAIPVLVAGCGGTYPLPTELRRRAIPSDKSYQMVGTWASMDSVQDLLLTQGLGVQLFVLFNRGGSGTSSRGDLHLYPLTTPSPIGGVDFPTLFNPVALAVGGDGRGSALNRVFVLDQGDTALAKTNQRVTRFDLYWRVREFGLLGGDTLSSFTDTTVAHVRSIAVDADGAVYVAGFAIVLIVDPQDSRIRTRTFQPRIYRYLRGPRYPGIVPPDPRMPGSNWHRDSTWAVEEGTGQGYLQDPRGLVWSATGGRALYSCDYGKNTVQKLSDQSKNTGLLNIATGENELSLYRPTSVSVSADGFVYVCDTGNQRVMRFAADGSYVQRVDHELDAFSRPLSNPVAVAANDSVAYVADRGRSEIIRYKRRP